VTAHAATANATGGDTMGIAQTNRPPPLKRGERPVGRQPSKRWGGSLASEAEI
jgi:hypothetical protein